MIKQVVASVVVLAVVSAASADVYITEWMYKGDGDEFIELTNLGSTDVDLTGWSFDDSHYGGVDSNPFDISALGTLAAGQSGIITEGDAATFRNDWGLDAGVPVVGGLGAEIPGTGIENGNNIGSSDTINIFDSLDNLVDKLVYDEDTIKTKGLSGNPGSASALGANDDSLWVLASVGDVYGSYESSNDDIGNPGTYVPEPATMSLLALAGLGLLRRRNG